MIKNLSFSLLLLPMFAAGQQIPNRNWSNSGADSVLAKKPIANSYVWRFDSSNVYRYYSVTEQTNYVIDSLVYKANLADSLCQELTNLSLTAEKYFMLLQEAYLELRRLKSDSLANRLQNVTWDRKFKICNIEKRDNE